MRGVAAWVRVPGHPCRARAAERSACLFWGLGRLWAHGGRDKPVSRALLSAALRGQMREERARPVGGCKIVGGFWPRRAIFFRSCRRAAAPIYELFEECTPIGALLRVFGVSRFQLRLSREDRCAGRAELGWFEKVTLPRVLTRTSRWLPRGDASRDVREAGRNN